MKLAAPLTRSRGFRAFTVVELLVAAAITAALAGFIAIIVRNVGTSWTRASARLSADTQARLVLDQLELDLQGALFREDGNTWMAVDVLNGGTGGSTGLWVAAARNPKPTGGLSLAMSSTSLADARFGTAGVWLRFFTTSRGTNTTTLPTVSAPVAVSYQIIRRYTATNPNNQNTAYLLHRAEARPTFSGTRPGVMESGYNITGAAYTTSTASTNNGATTGDPRSLQVPGSARNLDMVVADNVIDFGVRCYVRDAKAPGGLRLVFPAANEKGQLSNSATARLRAQLPSYAPATASTFANVFPDVIDVMVRILTDEGAAQIANLEKNQTPALTVPTKYNSNAQQWWWGVAQENSRVYTRRIVLNPNPN